MSPVRLPRSLTIIWHYTYILISEKDGHWYTGVTKNLYERLKKHNEGLVTSTRYRRPLRLFYYEACRDEDDAYRRERYLKTGMGKRYLRNRLRGSLTG